MIVKPYGTIVDGKKALRWSYFFLLMTAAMVPSLETHGFANLKTIAFLFSMMAFFYSLLFNPIVTDALQKSICWFLGGVAFIIGWFVVGREWGPYGVDQAKLFFITFWAIFLTFYLVNRRVVTREEVIRSLVYFSLAYAVCKILLGVIIVVKIWDPMGLMEKLGIRLVTISIFGALMRLQTSCDLFAPYMIFFVLMSERMGLGLSKRMRGFFIVVAWLSILLSFSRFLMAVGLCSHLLYAFSSTGRQWLKTIALGGVMAGLVVMAAGPARIAAYVEKRFLSEASYRSDEVRVVQTEALMELFEKAPILGQGLGAHSERVVRDPHRKHSYEVQWMAFLMQVGFVGISLLAGALGVAILYMLRPPLDRAKAALFFLFVIWLASGFTNPFMISLASGIIYALFLMGGELLGRREGHMIVQPLSSSSVSESSGSQ